MATLSSGDRVFSDVELTIPLRAATFSGPLMMMGIPALSVARLAWKRGDLVCKIDQLIPVSYRLVA